PMRLFNTVIPALLSSLRLLFTKILKQGKARRADGLCAFACSFGGNVNDGDHRSVDLVLCGAIRKNLEPVRPSPAIRKVTVHGAQTGHHGEDQRLEVRNFDGRVDIQKRPPDISWNQAQQSLCMGCETANVEIAADNDDCQVDAGEQVGQVAVNLGDFQISAVQFVV